MPVGSAGMVDGVSTGAMNVRRREGTIVSVRVRMLAAGLLCVVALASGCGPSSSASNLPASDPSGVIGVTCGRCHPLSRVEHARHDRAGWTATIARMRQHGARLTDPQAQAVIDFLAKRDGGS